MDKASSVTTMAARRPKWQYPPAPPTPRILHLPRRPRKKTPAKARDKKGKLETLFDQEREFTSGAFPIIMVSDQCQEERRGRVKEERESAIIEEENWRFQAEMLRAECNFLRMQREIAVNKMERRRARLEKALKSAVLTLLSGRKKICEGKEVSMVLEEEVVELVEKLEKLLRRSRSINKDLQVRKCSNFDKQAAHLQRQLEKFTGESDEACVKEIQEMAEASLSLQTPTSKENFASNCTSNMEILRRKMEGLSKGNLLERMEVEYGSMVSTANSSVSSSAANARIIEVPEMLSSSMKQPCKEQRSYEERPCSGGCKVIVRRVVEQVRAETEQWSQMQQMLEQVRNEMEELQASRDFWEDRALDSDYQIQTLQSAVKEWKLKACSSEAKASELQAQMSVLQAELERLNKEKAKERSRSSLHDSPTEMEKRVLVCRLKENRYHGKEDGCKQAVGSKKLNAWSNSGHNSAKRSPFGDIGNSSSPLLPLVKQNSRAVFPLHCPVPPSRGKSFNR